MPDSITNRLRAKRDAAEFCMKFGFNWSANAWLIDKFEEELDRAEHRGYDKRDEAASVSVAPSVPARMDLGI